LDDRIILRVLSLPLSASDFLKTISAPQYSERKVSLSSLFSISPPNSPQMMNFPVASWQIRQIWRIWLHRPPLAIYSRAIILKFVGATPQLSPIKSLPRLIGVFRFLLLNSRSHRSNTGISNVGKFAICGEFEPFAVFFPLFQGGWRG
jgi:hypothetical protein